MRSWRRMATCSAARSPAATANFFEFRSGLETLRVPRDRVRAAIWLKKPDPAAPTVARADDPVYKLLDQSIERRMGFGNATFACSWNSCSSSPAGS